MRLHAAGFALAACLVPAAAVDEDDAYHIDFHHALIGFPKHASTFFQKPYATSKASLLYTLSDDNIIAALNPKDGALVWRQAPPADASAKSTLRAGEDQDTLVSALGDRITAWSAADGRVVWENRVHGATVEDLEILEQEDGITDTEAKDSIVLLSGATPSVQRVDGKTGRVKWTYQDTSGDTPFQVSSSPTTIFYISLHTPMLGGWTKLRITSLSPITGKMTDHYTLNSEISSREDMVFAGANTAAPLLAWTDKTNKVLRVNIIGTKAVSTFTIPSKDPVERVVLHAPNRVNSLPHFLLEYQTAHGHSAEVFHVDLMKNTISKAYDLPHLSGRGVFATSTSDANVYFTRITADQITLVSSASHGVLGRWPVKDSPALAGAYPVHGVAEVAVKSQTASAVRCAILFSNGEFALVRNGEIVWTRPEFLSHAVSAGWAELPEEEALAHELEVEGHQSILAAYIHRVKRHVRDLEHLPAWLQALPKRVLGSFSSKAEDATMDEIQHDTFGFHKLVVVATKEGRLAALDVGAKGKLMWSTDLAHFAPGTTFHGPSLKPDRGYIEVTDEGFDGTLYINATTGNLISSEHIQIHLPVNAQGEKLVVFDLVDGELRGFLGLEPSSEPVWTFAPPKGERIVSYTARSTSDPIASIGTVLGDRRVLYKYLNPNLVLVTAVADSTHRASLYLLDSASGDLLYSVSHDGIDTTRPIPSVISENWLSYSLTLDATSSPESRGYLLIVADLFESSLPDDRGPLGASPNASTIQPSSPSAGEAAKPHVVSQTWHVPEEISHMAVTRTKQGITTRDLLVTLPNSNSIVAIPRPVIDPRRPVGRDPNANEAAEGLAKYTPFIPLDPKWVLNHKYELFHIKGVITSASNLESTSLVFAYGGDVFGTRVAPSGVFDRLGKGFNKVQMVGTVAALALGVLVVRPIVGKKGVDALWRGS
ncbi:DUF1620-domain-containing protein [Westerdykella ornata]|uniref:ER membrane protein complex subunit 1 n=1 Tax=Westerdykella ornata TaxID=318751 RepID=A0A6A6J9T1_WESOR|nr:DUF1620-domain-containing protein [Westerdykella ornata]KAF2272386.1 DUF1620-domain-containing protein [Westerdykella ornata]